MSAESLNNPLGDEQMPIVPEHISGLLDRHIRFLQSTKSYARHPSSGHFEKANEDMEFLGFAFNNFISFSLYESEMSENEKASDIVDFILTDDTLRIGLFRRLAGNADFKNIEVGKEELVGDVLSDLALREKEHVEADLDTVFMSNVIRDFGKLVEAVEKTPKAKALQIWERAKPHTGKVAAASFAAGVTVAALTVSLRKVSAKN